MVTSTATRSRLHWRSCASQDPPAARSRAIGDKEGQAVKDGDAGLDHGQYSLDGIRNYESVYGRDFVSDEDLEAQAFEWLEDIANVRRHRTTGEPPRVRFERDERDELKPLAMTPYPRLGVPTRTARRRLPTAHVEVERRALSVYAEAVR